ncbi:UNVERIFIED_CONTAM: hypothetical protein PYX00_000196 [Menopon gallinae]|uniref:DNA-directed RNA polymerase III subunit RPC5 n=1 Tax=Menopon gallinae TaxID=328185 RepID=A0AAW2I9J9_9NEOP
MEEDGIIKEIPVFLSQTLSKGLVVYQFPYGDGGLNPSNSNVIQCSIKENPHEIMLELERNTNSVNYSLARGEQIAINVDGRDALSKNPEDVTFPKSVMDRQTYISKSYSDLNFAVGVLHENELHLTPLETVSLLRPSFKYLDKSDKRSKSEGKDNTDLDFSGDDEEEPKQIVVKFARQESEKTKKARERSFSHVSKMNAKETWYKSNYYDKRTDKSEIEFSKLYCKKINEKTNEMKVDNLQLLTHLSLNDGSLCSNSTHGHSLSMLCKMPLVERVKKFLQNARLIQFSQLTTLLGGSSEVQDYLKAVQQVAVLVQGCWVVQSDIVYNKEVFPGGVPGSLMKRSRDYILYLFTKSRTVTRQKIQETVKLPSELIKQILEELSQLVPESNDWEFLLAADLDFIKSYPDVAQRQAIKWEMKHEQLIESFKNSDINLSSVTPSKHRRKSYRDSSLSSDNESGTENRRKGYQITGHKIRRTKKNSQSSDVTPQNS